MGGLALALGDRSALDTDPHQVGVAAKGRRGRFNLAGFLMRRRTDHALLLAERARRLLEPIGLAYVAQCEALVEEARGKLEPKVAADNMRAYEVLIEALYASLMGAMT